MVSYVKARAEGLGQKEFRGLMQRPERLILPDRRDGPNAPINGLLAPGCGDCTLQGTIVLLAVLTNFTAVQRLAASRKEWRRSGIGYRPMHGLNRVSEILNPLSSYPGPIIEP
jgi:CDP-diacylglycerol--glycerol-3-phosphate 3-phosphatidyltransferase